MKGPDRDPGLDTLLDLDGQVLVVDPKGEYWVKFVVQRVDPSPAQADGLNYSLSLHGPDNRRRVGFDNAHVTRKPAGPAGKSKRPYDHKHWQETVRPYGFKDAATLLQDFWREVDAVLKEKGIL